MDRVARHKRTIPVASGGCSVDYSDQGAQETVLAHADHVSFGRPRDRTQCNCMSENGLYLSQCNSVSHWLIRPLKETSYFNSRPRRPT